MKRFALCIMLCPQTVAADAPQVLTDILPVQSLVATVMDGVGEPARLLPAGVDPHHYSLRPSEAQALAQAELVIWVGPELTPWLEKPLEALAENAAHLSLLGGGDHDDHGHEDDDHDDHGHKDDDHDDHGDKDDHDHKDDDHEHDDDHADHEEHEGHEHGHVDPHLWLDPTQSAEWLEVIAEELAEIDPKNAAIYRQNAEKGHERLEALTAKLEADLAAVKQAGFITQHDGHGPFIERFGLNYKGSLSSHEAEDPSPADISRVRGLIASGEVVCVFGEVQLSPRNLAAVIEGSDVKSGTLDPLGAAVEAGKDAHEALLLNMGAAFKDCLTR